MKRWKASFVRHLTDGARDGDYTEHEFDATSITGALVKVREIKPEGFHLHALWRP